MSREFRMVGLDVALIGALGLKDDASDDDIKAELKRVEDLQNPTAAELDVRDSVRSALGLASDATSDEVLAAAADGLAALRAANAPPTPLELRVAAATRLPANSSSATIQANVRAIGARLRTDQAVAEGRVHRSQRASLFSLAITDFAAFEAAVSSKTVIGYPTAQAEYAALVEERREARIKALAENRDQLQRTRDRLAFAHTNGLREEVESLEVKVAALQREGRGDPATFALDQTSREYPDLAREVDDERRGANPADFVRAGAAAQLVAAVRKFTVGGKSWNDAIQLVAEENPELVRAYSTGTYRA